MRPFRQAFAPSHKPFTIGLGPLDVREWILIDPFLDDFLRMKDKIQLDHAEHIFVARDDSLEAQREAAMQLARYLSSRHPEIYIFDEDCLAFVQDARMARLGRSERPLHDVAMMIPDDLIIMQRFDDGWRLTAGSLCFPSSWTLHEKYDRPLQSIHGPVPAFGSGTKNAMIINRIFDHLKVDQPVMRGNWSLQGTRKLYHPKTEATHHEKAKSRKVARELFVRTERQTLTRLPVSNAILFTIRNDNQPLVEFLRMPVNADVAGTLQAQLESLDAQQLSYKGIYQIRDQLIALLQKMQDERASK